MLSSAIQTTALVVMQQLLRLQLWNVDGRRKAAQKVYAHTSSAHVLVDTAGHRQAKLLR
jgi:flagellar biosynthesis GTPase FlhF